MPLSKQVLSKYSNPIFIETGLGDGDGTMIAHGLGFPAIYSIELEPDRVLSFTKKLQGLGITNVELYTGNSPAILAELLKSMKGKAITFWLDSHPPDSPLPLYRCPLLKELRIITESGCIPTILIDDMRLFSKADKCIIANALWHVSGVTQIKYEDSPVANGDIMVGCGL